MQYLLVHPLRHSRCPAEASVLNLKRGDFTLEVRGKFFTWSGEVLAMPREVLVAPSLEVLKAMLDAA